MGISFKSIVSGVKKVGSAIKSKISKPAGANSGISNVVATLKAAVGKQGVQSNTGIKPLDKILAAGASHPFVVAAGAGTAANIPKFISLAKGGKAASSMAGAAQKAVSKNAAAIQRTNSNVGGTAGLVKPSTQTGGLLDLTSLGNAPATNPGILAPSTTAGGAFTGLASGSNASPQTTKKRKSSKRKKSSSRSRSKRRRSTRGKKKRRYGSAKQYARKGGKTVKYAKNGTPYIIMANGRARFIKGKRR